MSTQKHSVLKLPVIGMAFAFLIVSCFSNTVLAQDVVAVNSGNEVVNLAPHSYFLEDEEGHLTIDSFHNPGVAQRLKRLDKEVFNFGITSSVFWIKVRLQNHTPGKLLLELGNSALNEAQVFELDSQNQVLKTHHSGSWQKFSDREVPNEDYLFRLEAPASTTETIYIRVQHSRGTQFPLYAGTVEAFHSKDNNRDLTEGIYYGFILLMILYNLFIYFSLKDSAYIYYVVYIFLMGLLNASINGYAFRYLHPDYPQLHQYEDIISASVGIAGILFATNFLNTRTNTPGYHKLFSGLLVCYGIIILIVLSGNFLIGSVTVEVVSLVLVVSFFGAAYQTMRKGYRPAKFFLIAWTLLLLSVIVFILKDFDIIPYSGITVNSLQIGSAVEALLLSMALANRINVYKKEKEQAQMESLLSLRENEKLIREQNILLEQKVEERTRALKAANNDLVEAMENLNATQAQLVQKEKMASLGELTAGIAHEIQNPLNFVNNFSDINVELCDELKGEIEKLPIREELKKTTEQLINDLAGNNKKITHHGKRADAIVKGMLQHSRTSTGEKEPVDINTLVEEYLRLSYHGLRAKDKTFNAEFITHYDEHLGMINLIPQDIGRVLLNLFNNAFYSVTEKKKNSVAGYRPTVRVETKKGTAYVSIHVWDNGMGVPQKVIDKIFQPFFTTKPTGQGTGLGLSLSYDIITKGHEGNLKLVTKEGEYAEFIIELPLN